MKLARLTPNVALTQKADTASITFATIWDQLCKRVEAVSPDAPTVTGDVAITGYIVVTIGGVPVKLAVVA